MSIDTLARQAVDETRSHVSPFDVDHALDRTLAHHRRTRYTAPALVLAAVAVVAVIGWLLAGASLQSSPPLPADQPDTAAIGDGLPGPVTLSAPVGWEITHDDKYVELIADDDPDARLVVAVPDTVYDPPTYAPVPPQQDLLVWTLAHPAVRHSARYGVYQLGWTKDEAALPWQGQAMDLSLRVRATERESVPLVPLPGAPDGAPLPITGQDETFRWAVVYLEGSGPIVCAAISPAPDDQSTLSAFDDLLQSIHAQPSG